MPTLSNRNSIVEAKATTCIHELIYCKGNKENDPWESLLAWDILLEVKHPPHGIKVTYHQLQDIILSVYTTASSELTFSLESISRAAMCYPGTWGHLTHKNKIFIVNLPFF